MMLARARDTCTRLPLLNTSSNRNAGAALPASPQTTPATTALQVSKATPSLHVRTLRRDDVPMTNGYPRHLPGEKPRESCVVTGQTCCNTSTFRLGVEKVGRSSPRQGNAQVKQAKKNFRSQIFGWRGYQFARIIAPVGVSNAGGSSRKLFGAGAGFFNRARKHAPRQPKATS